MTYHDLSIGPTSTTTTGRESQNSWANWKRSPARSTPVKLLQTLTRKGNIHYMDFQIFAVVTWNHCNGLPCLISNGELAGCISYFDGWPVDFPTCSPNNSTQRFLFDHLSLKGWHHHMTSSAATAHLNSMNFRKTNQLAFLESVACLQVHCFDMH